MIICNAILCSGQRDSFHSLHRFLCLPFFRTNDLDKQKKLTYTHTHTPRIVRLTIWYFFSSYCAIMRSWCERHEHYKDAFQPVLIYLFNLSFMNLFSFLISNTFFLPFSFFKFSLLMWNWLCYVCTQSVRLISTGCGCKKPTETIAAVLNSSKEQYQLAHLHIAIIIIFYSGIKFSIALLLTIIQTNRVYTSKKILRIRMVNEGWI